MHEVDVGQDALVIDERKKKKKKRREARDRKGARVDDIRAVCCASPAAATVPCLTPSGTAH